MPTRAETDPSSRTSPAAGPHEPVAAAGSERSGLRRFIPWLVLAIIVAMGILASVWARRQSNAGTGGKMGFAGGAGGLNLAVPVVPGVVEQRDVPVYLDGLGTVQAFKTVTVRSRVDGQVQRVAFVEGQDVHAGDLLAQIDPAPFQAQLDQNLAKKAQDEAQLAVAKLTLTRNGDLLSEKILAQQDYDTQKGLVDQLVAALQADQATIDNAKVQLNYATITSPIDGRTGIRLVDEGNIVRASDSNGLVVLTQLKPISVVFTLPEQNLPRIQEALASNQTLEALAVDRDNKTPLGQGKLAVIDNQIDTSTGTIKMKATFPNENLRLWPGQFVNVRLHLTTRQGATVVPASVVQRGPDGTFAFVITSNLSVQVRPITVELTEQGQAVITEGLAPGEPVVVDGQYKLQAGSKVKLPDGDANSALHRGAGTKASAPPHALKGS